MLVVLAFLMGVRGGGSVVVAAAVAVAAGRHHPGQRQRGQDDRGAAGEPWATAQGARPERQELRAHRRDRDHGETGRQAVGQLRGLGLLEPVDEGDAAGLGHHPATDDHHVGDRAEGEEDPSGASQGDRAEAQLEGGDDREGDHRLPVLAVDPDGGRMDGAGSE